MKCGLCGTEVKRNTEAPRDLMYTPVAKQPTKPSVERVEEIINNPPMKKPVIDGRLQPIALPLWSCNHPRELAQKIVEEL